MRYIYLFLGSFLILTSLAVAEDSLLVQGQDAVGIYDTKIYGNDTNYGASATITVFPDDRTGLIKYTNLADTLGAGVVINHLYLRLRTNGPGL